MLQLSLVAQAVEKQTCTNTETPNRVTQFKRLSLVNSLKLSTTSIKAGHTYILFMYDIRRSLPSLQGTCMSCIDKQMNINITKHTKPCVFIFLRYNQAFFSACNVVRLPPNPKAQDRRMPLLVVAKA